MESKEPEVEVIDTPRSGRRRRFTAEEKRAFVEEAARPGNSVSQVARRYNLSPSLLFSWRRLMDEGSMSSLGAEEPVVPESGGEAAQGAGSRAGAVACKKTLEHEILKDAIEIAREKKLLLRSPLHGKKDIR